MDRRPTTSLPAAAAPLARVLGEVAWFSGERGFGFIRPDDGGEDVFVTWGVLPGVGFRSLEPGQRLTFVRDSDAHGPTARDVELLA
jgi:cold shock protein